MTQDDTKNTDDDSAQHDSHDATDQPSEQRQATQDEESKQSESSSSSPQDSELANIIEAALYAAKEPVGIRKLMALFPDDAQPSRVDIQNVILSLQEQCEHRGIELRRIGKGWRYQTKEKYAPWLRKLSSQKAPRYSRALLETLSIIAYRQPVTRGDIEEIRGVGVSSETIRTLEERGWVVQIGHRDVPGRPALFGTSQGFLEYFNMSGLSELPELMEKRELRAIAKEMNLTLPMDGFRDETTPDLLSADEEVGDPHTAEVITLRPDSASETEEAVDGTASDAENTDIDAHEDRDALSPQSEDSNAADADDSEPNS